MNHIYIYALFFCFLFFVMAIYFKLANKYNIIDKPNERSSHTLITVRGGGIIFPFAAFFYAIFLGFDYPWFLGGLLLISVISFIDDMNELNGKIRMIFQFIAIGMLFLDLGVFHYPPYVYLPLLVFGVAVLNAWNFMDGVNGITGGYSLLTILTLIYVNDRIVPFSSTGFMVAILLSLVVFIFYNFRTQARCFAGDIGSVSIAFIILFLLLRLILTTGNANYILFMLVYGLDAATTVFFRVIRREGILEAHRSHLYQYLANELKIPHNTVALLYIFVQFLINAVVIFFDFKSNTILAVSLLLSTIVFILVRFKLEGRERLMTRSL